jgi:hypothetical protein
LTNAVTEKFREFIPLETMRAIVLLQPEIKRLVSELYYNSAGGCGSKPRSVHRVLENAPCGLPDAHDHGPRRIRCVFEDLTHPTRLFTSSVAVISSLRPGGWGPFRTPARPEPGSGTANIEVSDPDPRQQGSKPDHQGDSPHTWSTARWSLYPSRRANLPPGFDDRGGGGARRSGGGRRR